MKGQNEAFDPLRVFRNPQMKFHRQRAKIHFHPLSARVSEGLFFHRFEMDFFPATFRTDAVFFLHKKALPFALRRRGVHGKATSFVLPKQFLFTPKFVKRIHTIIMGFSPAFVKSKIYFREHATFFEQERVKIFAFLTKKKEKYDRKDDLKRKREIFFVKNALKRLTKGRYYRIICKLL